MKFKLIVIVAVLAAFAVLAPSVSAQGPAQRAIANVFETVEMPIRMMGQNNCANAAPGSPEWLSWCQGVVTDDYGRVIDYNPNSVRGQRARGYRADDVMRNRYWRERGYGGYYGGYPGYGYGDYYGYGYGGGVDLNGRNLGAVLGGIGGGIATRHSRSGWVKAGGIVGGAVLGGILGNQVDRRNERRERESYEPSRSEMPEPQPPEAEEETQTSSPTPSAISQQVEQEKPKTGLVYVNNGWLCNDMQGPVVIHVDGRPIGKLSAGQMVEVKTLPAGKLGYKPMQGN